MAVRAPIERVAAALCAATGVSWDDDSTARRIVEAVVSEHHATVGDTDGVEFDPEAGEFRTRDGDIRLEVDRFPVDTEHWEMLVGVVALVGLVGVEATYTGVIDTGWLGVSALGFVVVGAAVRGAVRTEVSVVQSDD